MDYIQDMFEVFEEVMSDDEEEIIYLVDVPRVPRKFRIRPNHFDEWNDIEFLNRFRLSKQTVDNVFTQIEGRLRHATNRNHAVDPLLQLLLVLRLYATGDMLIAVGDFGGIHVSTMSRIVKCVSTAIAALSRRYIKMPSSEEELQVTKREFYDIARFPNVTGAIDCTHIKIQSPGGDNAEQFRNRKGHFSINVQTVACAKLKIRNIVARWPGATHDSTIFNNSRLKAQFEGENYRHCFLLGDSGYALSHYLMTPLLNVLTEAQQLYNKSQIHSRNVVERQYGVWKRRFPILSLGIRLKVDTALTVIIATAVLHNVAIEMNDAEPEEYVEIAVEDDARDHHQPEMEKGNLIRQGIIDDHFGILLNKFVNFIQNSHVIINICR